MIELTEYGSWVGVVDLDALDDLTRLAGDRLSVSRLPGGHVEIKAGAHVGSLVTPGMSVRIRPKVPLDNLFFMLGVGDGAWNVDRALAPYLAVDDDLVTAVVRLFSREVDAVTGRGLLHGYVPREERLLAIRGRVDLGAMMRRSWERTPVSCRFDEFVPDIWVNRALLAALAALRRFPALPPSLRGEVHLLTQRFDGVSLLPVTGAEVDRWRPTRNDRHYAVALHLASLILSQLSLADRSGQVRAASFTIDMNKLFEDFVGRELAGRLPSSLALVEQYSTHLGAGGRLPMYPDYVIHPAGQPRDPIYVADAKYKLTESLGVIGDHYQLLSYATVFSLGEGVLIYCQRPDGEDESGDEPPVTSITVRGAGIENFVYRLDVSGSYADIAGRLDELAAWLLGRIKVTQSGRLPPATGVQRRIA